MPFRLHPGVAFVRPFQAGLAATLLLMLPAPAPRPAPNAPAAGEASRAPQFRIYPYPTSGVGTNRLPNLTNVVDSFQVKNTGTTALTIALEESCSGSITCVSISTSQVSLNPGAATNVRVTYNTGSPGSATLNLFGEDVGGQALPRSSSPPLTFSVAVGAVVVTPDGATASP